MYYSDRSRDKKSIGFWEWGFIIFMVFFYPMLVSIYTMLPPLFGIVGLIIIYNIDKNKIYAMAGMVYLLNIDLNSSLPLFLSLFSITVIYLMVYPSAKLMIHCKTCLALFLIALVDAFCYMNLLIYDFIFSSKTIIADSTLVLYILIDIFIGLFL